MGQRHPAGLKEGVTGSSRPPSRGSEESGSRRTARHSDRSGLARGHCGSGGGRGCYQPVCVRRGGGGEAVCVRGRRGWGPRGVTARGRTPGSGVRGAGAGLLEARVQARGALGQGLGSWDWRDTWPLAGGACLGKAGDPDAYPRVGVGVGTQSCWVPGFWWNGWVWKPGSNWVPSFTIWALSRNHCGPC